MVLAPAFFYLTSSINPGKTFAGKVLAKGFSKIAECPW